MHESIEALSEIKASLDENKDFYGFAVLRGAYVKTPEGWKNALTKIILMKKGTEKEPDEKFDYKDILLVRKAFDIENIRTVIEKLFSDNLLKFDEFSFAQSGYVDKRICPSNDFFDWPGKLFTMQGEKPNVSQQPLVDYSKPMFRDAYHAIEKWVELPVFHGSSDARLGGVLIFLPEYKGKINRIKYHDGKLLVKADFNISQLDKVRCKALIKTSAGREIQESVDFEKDEVAFLTESPPVETYVYLVTSDNKTLDLYEETPFRHTGRLRHIAKEEASELSDIQTLILGGENETAEFKEKIEEEKTKKDLIKTAVAFANTKGGKILIGVNDNAEVVGIDYELRKNKSNKSKVKEKYDNILRDNVIKPLKYSTEFCAIGNKTLLIINVAEGEFKPYATKDNDIFIRVGATDRKPHPDIELKSLFPEQTFFR